MKRWLALMVAACFLCTLPAWAEDGAIEPALDETVIELGETEAPANADEPDKPVTVETEPEIEPEVTEDLEAEAAWEEGDIPYGLTVDGVHIAQSDLSQNQSGDGWTWDGWNFRLTLSKDVNSISFNYYGGGRSLFIYAPNDTCIGALSAQEVYLSGGIAVKALSCRTLDVWGNVVIGAASEAALLAKTDYSTCDGHWANNVYIGGNNRLIFANAAGTYFNISDEAKVIQLGEVTGSAVEMSGGTYEARGGVGVSYYLQNHGESILKSVSATQYISINDGTMTVDNDRPGVPGVVTPTLNVRNTASVDMRDPDDALEITTLILNNPPYASYEELYGAHTLVVSDNAIQTIDGWHGKSAPITISEQRVSTYLLENEDIDGDNWHWEHDTQTLYLDGYDSMDYPNGGITLDRNITVSLNDTANRANIYAKKGMRLTGSGILQGTISALGDVTISECYLTDAGLAYVSTRDGALTIEDSSVSMDGSIDLSGKGGDLVIRNSDFYCGGVRCSNVGIYDSFVVMGGGEVFGTLTLNRSMFLLSYDSFMVRDGTRMDGATAYFKFDGKAFSLTKNATLTESFIVPDLGVPLKVPKGKKLTIQKGCTLYLYGTLQKKGKVSGTVKVVKAPTSCKISGNGTMVVGASQQLKLTVTPSNATPDAVWVSSDESLATVDQNGKVTLLKTAASHIGEQVIIGAGSPFNAACVDVFIITIAPGTEAIALWRDGANVSAVELWLDPANKQVKLDAAISPANASKNVAWKTDSAKVATVDANGNVKAVKAGKTTVWAEATDGTGVKSQAVTVTVLKAPSSVKMPKTMSLNYDPFTGDGTSAKLNPTLSKGSASTLTYSGYNSNVVRVAPDGTVTAVGAGKTTVTVKTYNNKKATCTVTVVNPYAPTGVKLNKSGTVKLKVGQTLDLTATMTPDTAIDTLKWTTSKSSVATVADGTVTAVKKGDATITVATTNGKKATVKIKVS